MSATPETDKAERMAFSQEYMVPTDVARRLERERDEAREQIEVCRGIIDRTVIARNSALSELTVMERDCDEARAVIRMLWERAETFLDLSEEEIERVNRSWGASK